MTLDCRTLRQVVYTAVSTQFCGTALEFVRVSEKGYVCLMTFCQWLWLKRTPRCRFHDWFEFEFLKHHSITYQLQIDGFCRSWCPWKNPDFISWWGRCLSVQRVLNYYKVVFSSEVWSFNVSSAKLQFVVDVILMSYTHLKVNSKTLSFDSIYKKVALKRL